MKNKCERCGNENPKHGMKTCSRHCADEIKKINSREQRSCLYCKNDFTVRKKDSKKLCSEICRKSWSELPESIESRINASKEAVKEIYGVDNVFQLESIKDKIKETKVKKYGNENYNNTEQAIQVKKEKYGVDYGKNWYKIMSAEMKKNYGVEHPLQTKKFLDKQKITNLKRYGVESVTQKKEFKDKIIETVKEQYGVENISQNESIKQKKKDTSLEKFRVSHHLKDYDMFQKHQKVQYRIKKYKSTKLYYNGSYEKHFLELLEEKGLLHEVKSGQSFEYNWNREIHTYHTDFTLRGKQIEIKSGWTYNKNGKDKELEFLNETKWESVRNQNIQLVVLIDKSEIKGFIKAL